MMVLSGSTYVISPSVIIRMPGPTWLCSPTWPPGSSVSSVTRSLYLPFSSVRYPESTLSNLIFADRPLVSTRTGLVPVAWARAPLGHRATPTGTVASHPNTCRRSPWSSMSGLLSMHRSTASRSTTNAVIPALSRRYRSGSCATVAGAKGRRAAGDRRHDVPRDGPARSRGAGQRAAPRYLSAHLDELLETPQPGRRRLALVAVAPVRERDLPHVDVAPRIDGQPVRRDELARLQPGRAMAQTRQHLPLGTVDAHPRSDVGHVVVHAHAAADLAHVEARRGPTLQEQARGAMHVVPLRLVLAVAVEHLDAVVLAVGHVHPPLGVAADVVRDVELPGVGARLAPRAKQGAVRGVLVDACVAVAIGDVEIALGRLRRVRAAVKRLAAHVGPGRPWDPEGQQHLAIEGAVADGMVPV